jgi:hypothetical protein
VDQRLEFASPYFDQLQQQNPELYNSGGGSESSDSQQRPILFSKLCIPAMALHSQSFLHFAV